MGISKNPIASTIPLLPLGEHEFYAVIIPEKYKRGQHYIVWIFLNGCDTALLHSVVNDKNSADITTDGIRALDAIGHYDDIKEMLIETYN